MAFIYIIDIDKNFYNDLEEVKYSSKYRDFYEILYTDYSQSFSIFLFLKKFHFIWGFFYRVN